MTTPPGFDGGYGGSNYPGGSGNPPYGQQQNPYGQPETQGGGYPPPTYGPPTGGPPPMPPGRGPKSGLLWGAIGVLGVALVAVIAVFVVMLVTGGRSPNASTAATSSTAAPASPLTPAPTTAPSPSPAPAVVVAPPPAQPQTQVVEAPRSSGTRCVAQYGGSGSSASGNSGTTCAFAEEVRFSYNDAGGGTGYFDAYSPVTGKVYTMYCSGYAPVTCTGGNNALVYLY